MTDFSNEKLDVVREALAELREKQEENGKLHMGFSVEEVKNKVPSLKDETDKYIHKLLETLKNAGERIEVAGVGIGPWKFF